MSDSIFLTDGEGAIIELIDKNYSGELVIPEYIGDERITALRTRSASTSMGYAGPFQDCEGITSVVIPDSVTYIGAQSFYGCTYLASVTMPNNVTTISNNAFSFCLSLVSITIPDSVTFLATNAFRNAIDLRVVFVPDPNNLSEAVSNYPWSEKVNIMAIEQIPKMPILLTNGNGIITSIFDKRYSGELVIPEFIGDERITEIGTTAFDRCHNLTSVVISNGVTSIGDGAFDECTSLASVIISDSVASIGNQAFFSCASLSSVAILDSVVSIGDMAFEDCTSLTTVYVSDPNNLSEAISSYDWSGTYSTGVTFKQYVVPIDMFIKNTTLINLADKIRILSGEENAMTPAEMGTELDEASAEVVIQTELIEQLMDALDGKAVPDDGAGGSADESELIRQSEIMDEILALLAEKNPELYPDGAFRVVTALTAGKTYVLAFSYEGVLRYLTDTAFNDWTVQAADLSVQDNGSYVTFSGTPTRFTAAASDSGFTFTATAGSLTGNASSGGTDLKVDSNAGTVFTVDTSETGGFDSGVYIPKADARAVWLRADLNSQNCCLKYESANISVGIDYAGRDATYSTGFVPFLLYELCEREAMA